LASGALPIRRIYLREIYLMAKNSNDNNKTRINWGKEFSLLPKLDLLAIQKESYQWFLDEGIKQILEEISPIDDFTEKTGPSN